MSTSLATSLQSSSSSDLPVLNQIHLLPFHTSFSGPSQVSAYFSPTLLEADIHATEDTPETYRAYFRGRLLLGNRVTLPKGYTGQIWRSNAPTASNQQSTSQAASSRRNGSTASTYEPIAEDSPRKHATQPPPAKKQKTLAKGKLAKSKGKQKRQRFALDDDDNEEEEEVVDQPKMEVEDHTDSTGGQDSELPPKDGQVVHGNETSGQKIEEEQSVVKDVEASGSIAGEAVPDFASDMKPIESPKKADEFIENGTIAAGNTSRPSTPPPSSAATLPEIVTIPSTPAAPGIDDQTSTPSYVSQPQTPRASAPFKAASEQDKDDLPMLDDKGRPQRILKALGNFEEITLWNPDTAPDLSDDCYVKGLRDWVLLSSLIHQA